ncbi:MAG: PH domain-containing protein [Anaerolineaceae bacterium]|nr:PH domain-containing protein [Anaerolineaceae bacterium]
MGYIENNLGAGEVVVYRARLSFAVLFWPLIESALLIWLSTFFHELVVYLAIFLSIKIVLPKLFTILTTQFALTNRRIIAKKGFIKHRTIDILLNHVESITISQPIDGRLFGFGTVTVKGSGGTREFFTSISSPTKLRNQVNEQIAQIQNVRQPDLI